MNCDEQHDSLDFGMALKKSILLKVTFSKNFSNINHIYLFNSKNTKNFNINQKYVNYTNVCGKEYKVRSDTKAIIDHIKSCEECVFNCDYPQFIFEHIGKDAKESAIALNEKSSSEEDDEKAPEESTLKRTRF